MDAAIDKLKEEQYRLVTDISRDDLAMGIVAEQNFWYGADAYVGIVEKMGKDLLLRDGK